MKQVLIFTKIALASLIFTTALAAPTNAQTSAESAQNDIAERQRLATELSRSLNYAISVEEQIMAVSGQMKTGLLKDPSVREMETAYPGIVEFMVDAMVPAIIGITEERMPSLITEVSNLYAANMSVSELEDSLEFYKSETGQKIVRATVENLDVTPMMDEMLSKKFQGEMSEQSFSDTMNKTASSVLPKVIGKEDRLSLLKYATTPASRKMRELQPETTRIVAKWTNQTDPNSEAIIEKISITAALEYIKATEEGREPILPKP